MANTIKVSTSKLTSTASSFQSSASRIQKLTNQMTSTVNSMTGTVWSGDAANAYKKKFNELQDDINKMYKMISEHSDDLKQMASTYEAAEQQNIAAANSLSGDVIS